MSSLKAAFTEKSMHYVYNSIPVRADGMNQIKDKQIGLEDEALTKTNLKLTAERSSDLTEMQQKRKEAKIQGCRWDINGKLLCTKALLKCSEYKIQFFRDCSSSVQKQILDTFLTHWKSSYDRIFIYDTEALHRYLSTTFKDGNELFVFFSLTTNTLIGTVGIDTLKSIPTVSHVYFFNESDNNRFLKVIANVAKSYCSLYQFKYIFWDIKPRMMRVLQKHGWEYLQQVQTKRGVLVRMIARVA